VLDVDDDDEGLSRAFARSSLMNRARLHPFAQLNPRRIRSTLRSALDRADGLTYATEAVRAQVGLVSTAPAAWIPHPRFSQAVVQSPHQPGRIEIGFLGTARGHKGVDVLERLVRSDARLRLHAFAGALPASVRSALGDSLLEHAPDQDLRLVYESVDLIVLPQLLEPAAQVQLPAKLLDALSFGVPVMTSPTTAIREVARDSVTYIEDWADIAAVSAAITAITSDPIAGQAGHARFEQSLSLTRSAATLRSFADDLFGFVP
jgi:glycosyltransferase involved in cell wall biosynthesis